MAMFEDGGPKILRLIRWTAGDTAVAQVQMVEGSATRPLVAIEAFERLAALLASTAVPQSDVARRLSPQAPAEPIALLTSVRAARIYLAIAPGSLVDIECQLSPEQAELVVAKGEVRASNGERAAKADLQFLIVPGTGEHLREAQQRDALRKRLLGGVE
jgi:hypothetical protein